MNLKYPTLCAALLVLCLAFVHAASAQTPYTTVQYALPEITRLSNPEGTISFLQDVFSPSDKAFSLHGPIVTSACVQHTSTGDETHYTNVKGVLKKQYTLTAAQLIAQAEERAYLQKRSCQHLPELPTPVRKIIKAKDTILIADLTRELTTEANGGVYAVSGMDGFLFYDLPKSVISGDSSCWIPQHLAPLFMRKDAVLEYRDERICLYNQMEGTLCAGDTLRFEGYADLSEQSIAAVEFSLDRGATWTTCAAPDKSGERWLYWKLSFALGTPGDYQLDMRAIAEDGSVSPIAASILFSVR